MTPAIAIKKSPLTLEALRDAAGQQGPCLTLEIPDRHPGVIEPSRATLVRGMARLAEDKITEQKLDAASLLQPIAAYASQADAEEGGPGVALLCAPGFLSALAVQGIAESRVTLSRYFNLAPLMRSASEPHDFYVLGLSRKNLRFFRYQHGHCEQIDLPTGVPANMEAALDLDQPDHTARNRSASGNSTGSLHAVPFGTSPDREAAGARLHHFFQMVDRGLKDLPVLLAGVHEEVAAYRRAAHSRHLWETEIHGNIDFLTPAEIAEHASTAARAHYRCKGQSVLASYQEMPDRKRTCGTVRTVLSAAMDGRVHQLCAAEDTGFKGPLTGQGGMEQEDLVNAAIVETLRHGGEVFMLPPDDMPEGAPLAAILRF